MTVASVRSRCFSVPIIATLASGLVASSATLVIADGFTALPDPGLRNPLNLRPLGVPLLAIVVAALTVLAVLLLRGTTYGRSLTAIGQNTRAAERAGLPVVRITALTYLASGALAGLAGTLLATYIAPTPDLGTRYLLDSIAVVVIGGTLISGGRAVPAGVWGGALFFILLDGLVNLVGWSTAAQHLPQGLPRPLRPFPRGRRKPPTRRCTRPPHTSAVHHGRAPHSANTGGDHHG
ncbi:ABC transporter permease [Streptomyces hirsutus]